MQKNSRKPGSNIATGISKHISSTSSKQQSPQESDWRKENGYMPVSEREVLRNSLLDAKSAKLIIKPRVSLKVWSLLAKIHSNEWSGVTFFRMLQGSLEKPGEIVIEMIDFFLMDLGSSAFTSFKYTPEITEYQMENPHLIEDGVRTGCLHSHHTMRTFFSGEDIDDLVINTRDESVDFYLSTIVNVDGEWISRIAFRMKDVVEKSISSKFLSKLMKSAKILNRKETTEEQTLYMILLEVIQEEYVDTEIRIEALKEASRPKFDDLRRIPTGGTESGRSIHETYQGENGWQGVQARLFDKDAPEELSEAQEEEQDQFLGMLMTGTVAFKDGL